MASNKGSSEERERFALLRGLLPPSAAIARAVIAVKILKRFKFLPRIDKNFDYYFCCAVACLCLRWLLLLTLAAAAKAKGNKLRLKAIRG